MEGLPHYTHSSPAKKLAFERVPRLRAAKMMGVPLPFGKRMMVFRAAPILVLLEELTFSCPSLVLSSQICYRSPQNETFHSGLRPPTCPTEARVRHCPFPTGQGMERLRDRKRYDITLKI